MKRLDKVEWMTTTRIATRWNGSHTIICAALAIIFIIGQPLMAGPLDRFYALEDAMSQAHEDFLEAIANQHQGHDHAGHDHSAHAKVADARLGVLKKMDALTKQTLGTKDGATIALSTFNWSWQLDLDLNGLFGRFEEIGIRYPNEPEVEDLLSMMSSIGSSVGDPKSWVTVLQRLAETSTRKRIRSAAYYAMGELQLKIKQHAQAKSAFQQVMKVAPRSNLATLAKGGIYEIDHLQIGMVAPDFTTRSLEGKEVSLKSLRGKVVLLDFWATWCVVCVTEMPHLRESAGKLKDESFTVLGISLDHSKGDLTSMMGHLRLPGIQTWDEAGIENPVGMLYNANALPTMYLIDPQGVIRARDPDIKQLPQLVRSILRK